MCAVSKTAEPYRAWRPCILCLPALVDDSTPPRRGSGNSVFWDNPFSQLAWASALSRQRSIRVRIRRGQNKEPILGISYLACVRGICRLVLSLAGPDIPPASILSKKKKKKKVTWTGAALRCQYPSHFSLDSRIITTTQNGANGFC